MVALTEARGRLDVLAARRVDGLAGCELVLAEAARCDAEVVLVGEVAETDHPGEGKEAAAVDPLLGEDVEELGLVRALHLEGPGIVQAVPAQARQQPPLVLVGLGRVLHGRVLGGVVDAGRVALAEEGEAVVRVQRVGQLAQPVQGLEVPLGVGLAVEVGDGRLPGELGGAVVILQREEVPELVDDDGSTRVDVEQDRGEVPWLLVDPFHHQPVRGEVQARVEGELVGAALGDDVDHPAGDVAVLWTESTSDDLELFDRVEVEVQAEGVGRRVGGVDAVHEVLVGIGRAAVDGRVAPAGDAREDLHGVLVGAPAGDPLQEIARDALPDGHLLDVDHRHLADDRDHLLRGPGLQPQDAGDRGAESERDALLVLGAEPRSLRVEGVPAGRQLKEAELTIRSGRALLDTTDEALAEHGDLHPGDRCTLGVLGAALDGPGLLLGPGGRRVPDGEQQGRDQPQGPAGVRTRGVTADPEEAPHRLSPLAKTSAGAPRTRLDCQFWRPGPSRSAGRPRARATPAR